MIVTLIYIKDRYKRKKHPEIKTFTMEVCFEKSSAIMISSSTPALGMFRTKTGASRVQGFGRGEASSLPFSTPKDLEKFLRETGYEVEVLN